MISIYIAKGPNPQPASPFSTTLVVIRTSIVANCTLRSALLDDMIEDSLSHRSGGAYPVLNPGGLSVTASGGWKQWKAPSAWRR